MTEIFLKSLKILLLEEIFVFLPLIFLFYYSFFSIFKKRKKNLFINILIFLLPYIYIFYNYSYLPNFFASIGQESLMELDADFAESIFYIKTFFSFLFDLEILQRKRFWLIFLSSFLSAVFLYIVSNFIAKIKRVNLIDLNKYFNIVFFISFLTALVVVINVIEENYKIGENLNIRETEFRKNNKNFNSLRKSKESLKVIAYIGESTSALNLSMYGYPFSTSPWLDSQLDNEKIIKFDKVFSTHTHSTPSLIDALSLCISEDKQKCLGVDNLKNNLSIIELMSKAGVETNLYSTQGNLGGHNFASKLLLNTDNKFFTSNIETNSKNLNNLLGNRYKPVIKDKDFFSKYFCDNKDIFNKNMPSLSVLHSYAGHGLYGGYLGYIPKRELIKYPDYVNKQNFLGKDHKNFKLINEYDTVINYIDETLEKVVFCSLNESQQNNQPAIFVYFSDHGESPATARGHDSSRLTYEMLHVPLIILFNEKAFNIYNDKFNYLKKLSNSNLTLKSISDILIYLFDVEVIASENNKLIYSYKNFKSLLLDFIMVQKDLMGNEEKLQTFFKYDEGLSESGFKESQFVKNDTSINLWQLNNYLETKKLTNRKNIENMVCKHRANSFITQYAASLSNGCFETDVFFVDNKVISTHELKESTDLVFSNFLDSSYQKTTVWLDSKNLSKSQNCKLANKWLSKNSPKFKSILIELPANSSQNEKNQKWLECIKNIKSLENVQVGYYMPTNILKKCSDFKKEKNNIDCNKSLSKIKNFLDIAKIQSITFDFVGYQAIKRYKIFDEFKWHVWNINNLKSFDEIIKNKNIGIVLLKNGKFSNNLN